MSKTRIKAISGYSLLGLWLGFFLWAWPKLFFMTDRGLFAGFRTIWGDWSAHLAYASAFAHRPMAEWFTNHPLYYGVPFNYPFGSSLISGLAMRLGADYVSALLVPSIVLTLVVATACFCFYRRLLGGPLLAGLGLTMFLTGSGFGFLAFLSDVANAKLPIPVLAYPPREYGMVSELGIEIGGILSCNLLPQRAAQLGLAIGLTVLIIMLRRQDADVPARRQIVAGGLFGLMPIVHVHTLMVLLILFLFYYAARWRECWRDRYFLVTAALVGPALVLWFHYHSIRSGMMGFQPGWLAKPRDGRGFLWFWWLNWSLFFPLSIMAICHRWPWRWPVAAAGVFLFVVANLVRLQPWDWDNTKIFLWCYLLLTPCVLAFLARLWAAWPSLVSRFGLAAAYLVMISTGAIEAYRLLPAERTTIQMWSRAEIEMAEAMRAIAPAGSLVLTPGTMSDWVASLSGLQILKGFDGWLWSYGINPSERRGEVLAMYRAESRGIELLGRYDVDFVVIDQTAKREFQANTTYFAQAGKLVMTSGETQVYRLKSSNTNKQARADESRRERIHFIR